MAEAEVQETVDKGPQLKYLWFIPLAVIKATAYVTALYVFIKDSSGPLKPGINRIEEPVKRVVGQLYLKIDGKPQYVLAFTDRKVDDVAQFFDRVLPVTVKQLGTQAYDVSKSTVADVQQDGVFSTAKGYFDKYEPIAEAYGIRAYKKALTFPLVPQAAAVTRYFAVKANQIITFFKDSGLPLASYLPLLPVSYFDRITRSD